MIAGAASGEAKAAQPASLTLREIIDSLFGFPETDPRGPTLLTILPPLLNCDTKSYDDLVRIAAMMFGMVNLWTCVCVALYGDGQTVLRARDLRRKWRST